MIIERGDPRHPEATALLQQSHALMRDLFPPEDNYFLDIEDLCTPDIAFFVAKIDGTIHGTAALRIKTSYAELKSMFVDPNKRGAGIANALVAAIEKSAKEEHLTLLRLETSSILKAAVKLYTRHGFRPCGIFGDYQPNTTSLFMEKSV